MREPLTSWSHFNDKYKWWPMQCNKPDYRSMEKDQLFVQCVAALHLYVILHYWECVEKYSNSHYSCIGWKNRVTNDPHPAWQITNNSKLPSYGWAPVSTISQGATICPKINYAHWKIKLTKKIALDEFNKSWIISIIHWHNKKRKTNK